MGYIACKSPSKLYKMRQQRCFFFPGNFECFAGFATLALFVSTLELLHKKQLPAFLFLLSFVPLVASPSQQLRSELWAAPAAVFTGVLGCSAESKGTNQERTNPAVKGAEITSHYFPSAFLAVPFHCPRNAVPTALASACLLPNILFMA